MIAPLAILAAAAALPAVLGAAHSKTGRKGPADWSITKCGPGDQRTQWSASVNPSDPWPEYPLPQFSRESSGGAGSWATLNGMWEFQAVSGFNVPPPFNTPLNESILVPFPPEACVSGLGAFNDWPNSTPDYRFNYYRLTFDSPVSYSPPSNPPTASSPSYVLHFEAVDWNSTVWLNGQQVATHIGGYSSFSADVTQLLKASDNELIVFAHDPTEQGAQPNGKQRIDRILNPGGDTYAPTSGIWQTVWLEKVPALYRIDSLKMVPSTTGVTFTVGASGYYPAPVGVATVNISLRGVPVTTGSGQVGKPFTVPIPNPQLWGPGSPTLYDVTVVVTQSGTPGGTGSDRVDSYFGLRSVGLVPYTTPGTPDSGPQVGVDRGGGDLPGSPFTLPQADYNLCWAQCNATSACQAWAYAIPSCDGYKQPTCWLKGPDHGGPSADKCRVSGEKATPGGPGMRPAINGNFTFLATWLDQSWWPDGQYTAPTDDALASDLQAVGQFGLNGVRLHQKVNPSRWYYHADRLGVVVLADAVQKYGGASAATVPYWESDFKAYIDTRGNHPSIVQWETFNEGDCWEVFDVPKEVAWTKAYDPSRLVDTDSGGGANNLLIGDAFDVHNYPYPGFPKPSATQYAMQGEFGGIGAFIPGHEWVPGKCSTYLAVPTPHDEASTYINMTTTLLARRPWLSVSVVTQITDVERECDGFLNMDRTNKFNAQDMAAIVAANQALISGKSEL